MANDKVYTDYLMHGRTKGSRNGISTTKGYTAVGQKAKGRWVNGRYVYDKSEQNNWQQLGDAHRSALTMNNSNSRAQDYRGMPASAATEIIKRDNAKMEKRPEVKAFNAWHNARQQHNAEVAGKNAAYDYAKKQKSKRQTNIGTSQAGDAARNQSVMKNNIKSGKTKAANMAMDGIEFTVSGKGKTIAAKDDAARSHQNAVSQAAAERAGREAALARQKKANKKKSAILSDVRMIPINNPKDKYDYSGKNDDRAPVFKEATYIDLYGNKTGGKVTKMDRTPYWDHMANAKTNKEFDKYAKKSKEFLDDFRASKIRNSRSDIGNAYEDFKQDAKNTFKALKSKFKKKKK